MILCSVIYVQCQVDAKKVLSGFICFPVAGPSVHRRGASVMFLGQDKIEYLTARPTDHNNVLLHIITLVVSGISFNKLVAR